MSINVRRKASMERKSDTELARFVKAKTLSSAAALFELKKRHNGQLPVHIINAIG